MELEAPYFWHVMLQQLFGVRSPQLRAKIWASYPKSTALVYQLERCAEPAPTDLLARDRVKYLAHLLQPQLLLRAAEALAPPDRPQPKELRDFQERVLQIVDAHGHFIWLKPERKDPDGQRRSAGNGPA